MNWHSLIALTATICSLSCEADGSPTPVVNATIRDVFEGSCFDCHNANDAEGDLDLTALPFTFKFNDRDRDQSHHELWVRIYDRVDSNEMPPGSTHLEEQQRKAFLSELRDALHAADLSAIRQHGRGPLRRLTRTEFEHNLRDLLQLPQLDIRDRLPEERTSLGLSKAAATLDLSHVHLAAFLDAAEAALQSAIAPLSQPLPTHYHAQGTDLYPKLGVHAGKESMHFSKHGKMMDISNEDFRQIQSSGKHDPELEMALFRSATWPFYGYPRGFSAPHDGAYRLRFRARAVRQLPGYRLVPALRPVPLTFRARQPSLADVSGDVRETGGLIDIQPDSAVYETTLHLKEGETFEYSLLGLPVPHPITSHGGPLYYNFPPMPSDGHPGIAFQWLDVDGPLPSAIAPSPSYRLLFGDLEWERINTNLGPQIRLITDHPNEVIARRIESFAQQAARQPIAASALSPFQQLARNHLATTGSLLKALLAAYQAFLASGHVLYLQEPLASDDNAAYAIASRLSHFLWNSRPDPELLRHAAAGRIRHPDVLHREVTRMVKDPRFERCVNNFTDGWLDLRELRRDTPDIRLYPEYRKDDYLVESMGRETRAYFATLVRENLSINHLIDSDFVLINDRLSRHYGLPPVSGSSLRRVILPKTSPYGGLLTQSAILKLTANGTSTSPVLRGAWIMKKLLGNPPPRPPASVPAVEPDLRGTKTIREILSAHTKAKACARCHARFDPVGFALENFDVMGAWRDHYRGLEQGNEITGIDRAGHRFAYYIGAPVDSSGQLITGDRFDDINDLKQILITRPRQLARNLLEHFTLYATGTPVRFSDRKSIEAILTKSQATGYRVADLIHGLVQSPVFLGIENTDRNE